MTDVKFEAPQEAIPDDARPTTGDIAAQVDGIREDPAPVPTLPGPAAKSLEVPRGFGETVRRHLFQLCEFLGVNGAHPDWADHLGKAVADLSYRMGKLSEQHDRNLADADRVTTAYRSALRQLETVTAERDAAQKLSAALEEELGEARRQIRSVRDALAPLPAGSPPSSGPRTARETADLAASVERLTNAQQRGRTLAGRAGPIDPAEFERRALAGVRGMAERLGGGAGDEPRTGVARALADLGDLADQRRE